MSSNINKKCYIICSIVIITFLIGIAIYLEYVNRPKTIEAQISSKLDIKEKVELFDAQSFGKYQIVGFEYSTNEYGVAQIKLSRFPIVEEVKTTNDMLKRAEQVWNCSMNVNGEIVYTFLCVNNEVKSILWIEDEQKKIITINHTPSVINIVHNPGQVEYYLQDDNGNEM